MAKKRTGSRDGRDAGPRDEAVDEAPRGYSIYSEKAERAQAEAAGATAAPEAAAPEAVASEAVAPGVVEHGAVEDGARAAMTPEEAAREAREDAEILGAVDAAVARQRDPEIEPETVPEPIAGSEPSAEETAKAPEWQRDERPMPETAAARPAPRSGSAPRSEPAYSPPPPREAAKPSGGIAGKLLGALLFLLIGAGLALWLGPKFAPNLPAPIAKFLQPGGAGTETRLAALDQAVADLRGEIAGRPAGVTEEAVEGAVAQASGRLEGEITALRDQIGAGAGVAERLARVESAAQGAQAELAALKQQIGAAPAAPGAAQPELDVYRGEIDGLRAEMGTLSDQVAGLRSRVEEVGAEARRQIETAQATVESVQAEATQAVDTAAREADVASVGAALAAGQPFAEPLARLAALPDAAIPAGLSAAAESGAPTLATLRDGFPEAAHAAIRASIVEGAGEGMLSRAGALFRAQFATRSLTPKEGAGPDAVLSRMGDRINHDDLAGALAESSALPSEAKAAMSGWLEGARLRAEADAALAELRSATPATN